jgi:hypothetical protein
MSADASQCKAFVESKWPSIQQTLEEYITIPNQSPMCAPPPAAAAAAAATACCMQARVMRRLQVRPRVEDQRLRPEGRAAVHAVGCRFATVFTPPRPFGLIPPMLFSSTLPAVALHSSCRPLTASLSLCPRRRSPGSSRADVRGAAGAQPHPAHLHRSPGHGRRGRHRSHVSLPPRPPLPPARAPI